MGRWSRVLPVLRGVLGAGRPCKQLLGYPCASIAAKAASSVTRCAMGCPSHVLPLLRTVLGGRSFVSSSWGTHVHWLPDIPCSLWCIFQNQVCLVVFGIGLALHSS